LYKYTADLYKYAKRFWSFIAEQIVSGIGDGRDQGLRDWEIGAWVID
jgi:hypothetical protein